MIENVQKALCAHDATLAKHGQVERPDVHTEAKKLMDTAIVTVVEIQVCKLLKTQQTKDAAKLIQPHIRRLRRHGMKEEKVFQTPTHEACYDALRKAAGSK